MSDDRELPTTNDELSGWIIANPEIWNYVDPGAPVLDDAWVDAMVDKVLASVGSAANVSRRRRRRRRFVGGTCAVLVIAGGAAGVAAILKPGQPSTPEAGITCRAEARVDSEAIVISADKDPIGGCQQVWRSGQFNYNVVPSDGLQLTACVDPRGPIAVFPGGPAVCAGLGLAAAEPALSPDNEAIVSLQDRLTNEINLANCQRVTDVASAAREALARSGLSGWHVEIAPGAEAGNCGKASVRTSDRAVLINDL